VSRRTAACHFLDGLASWNPPFCTVEALLLLAALAGVRLAADAVHADAIVCGPLLIEPHDMAPGR